MNQMNLKVITASLMLGILCGCASVKRANTVDSPQNPPGIRKFLQGFADSCSEKDIDYFFLSPVSTQNGSDYCYAYWLTGNSIIIIDLPIGKIEDPIGYLWYAGNARIDLATGVVPTREDVGSSTYLVDSTWVASILRDCLGSGIEVVIRKTAKKMN